jgi:hypothetical protein
LWAICGRFLDDWSAGRELGEEGEEFGLGNECVIERFSAYYLQFYGEITVVLDGNRPWPAALVVLIGRCSTLGHCWLNHPLRRCWLASTRISHRYVFGGSQGALFLDALCYTWSVKELSVSEKSPTRCLFTRRDLPCGSANPGSDHGATRGPPRRNHSMLT